jgi:hypothetical protein
MGSPFFDERPQQPERSFLASVGSWLVTASPTQDRVVATWPLCLRLARSQRRGEAQVNYASQISHPLFTSSAGSSRQPPVQQRV